MSARRGFKFGDIVGEAPDGRRNERRWLFLVAHDDGGATLLYLDGRSGATTRWQPRAALTLFLVKAAEQ